MNNTGKGPVGLIAGEGRLPVLIARSIETGDRKLQVWGFKGLSAPEIEISDRVVHWVDFGQLEDLLKMVRDSGIVDLVLAGRVRISSVLMPQGFDEKMSALIKSAGDMRGHTLLGALVSELNHEGFNVLSNLEAAPDLITPNGHLAGPAVEPGHLADVRTGWDLAKDFARRDIGQTVVVRGGAVVAVEAMEGTSEAIRRAGELAGSGIVVVKVARDDQDPRYDIPTVGPATVNAVAGSGGGVLAVEAGMTFLVDRDETLSLCEEAGVSLIGVDRLSLETDIVMKLN